MNFLKRTWAEIDLDALNNNVSEIKKVARGKKLIAVVKANAYGHDDEIICSELYNSGIDTFAVSNIWEAEDLRKILPYASIIIFGYTEDAFFASIIENNFIPIAGSAEYAKRLNNFAVKTGSTVNVHVKIDTGMSRVGIDADDTTQLEETLALDNLSVSALCTHFSVSDGETPDDYAFTRNQHEKLAVTAKKYGLPFHSQNSGGILFHDDFDGDFVRMGLVMYGYYPNNSGNEPLSIKPVMSLKSAVSQLKTIKKGADVGYGRTYTAPTDIYAAIIPVGYADGYNRALSNKGKVLINGVLCPVIGRVCMDQIIVDVSRVPEIRIGDIAELYSDKSTETRIEHISEILGTIPYEITCAVGYRVPRIATRNSKPFKVARYC